MYKLFKYSDENHVVVLIKKDHYNNDYTFYDAEVTKILKGSGYIIGQRCGPNKKLCYNVKDPNTLLKRLL